MCFICSTDKGKFVLKHDEETMQEWFDRLKHIDGIDLVMMNQTEANLALIRESYDVQGFVHKTYWLPQDHDQKPEIILLNVLLIGKIVFITYGERFAKLMRWTEHAK